MLCDICGKIQATVHLTEIIDEQMTELHLCEGCAKKKGAQMEKHFGLSDLLAGLADIGEHPELAGEKDLRCPACGLTYNEFKKAGRFGCSSCYTSFKKNLLPLLKRIHGSSNHIGKSPSKKRSKPVKMAGLSRADKLKADLQSAIDAEEFEEAAKLRDKIKGLEKNSRGKK